VSRTGRGKGEASRPRPGSPYGRCERCGRPLVLREEPGHLWLECETHGRPGIRRGK
jgi:hypothetical protein